jgi:glycerol-3-phosphate cytidylyltransferase
MKKIITYGTFDTIHYGHLELLRRAKELGDHLTVGLSTDEFNKLKGKESLFDYEKRYEWLSNIKWVDEIIPESSWDQKLDDLRHFDQFVMGDDWQGHFDELGCIYLTRTEKISSTKIKQWIKK